MKNTFLAVVMSLGFVVGAQAQRIEGSDEAVKMVQTKMFERDNSRDDSLDNSTDPNARAAGCRVLKHSNYNLNAGVACVSCGGAGWFEVSWHPDWQNGGTVWESQPISSCSSVGM